jgi:hypothetical protein
MRPGRCHLLGHPRGAQTICLQLWDHSGPDTRDRRTNEAPARRLVADSLVGPQNGEGYVLRVRGLVFLRWMSS